MSEHLEEQELVRREKLQEFRYMGIDPFGKAFKLTHHSKELLEKFENST